MRYMVRRITKLIKFKELNSVLIKGIVNGLSFAKAMNMCSLQIIKISAKIYTDSVRSPLFLTKRKFELCIRNADREYNHLSGIYLRGRILGIVWLYNF